MISDGLHQRWLDWLVGVGSKKLRVQLLAVRDQWDSWSVLTVYSAATVGNVDKSGAALAKWKDPLT